MKDKHAEDTTVIFEVLRYRPGVDKKPRMQEYEIPLSKGMTVLDGLTWIKENVDPTLSWRSSCRMGVCGSCGMFINGKARLACNNQIVHLNSKRIRVKPLPNFDIIRDLVPDLESFFAKHQSVHPFIIRKNVEELDNPTGEFFQTTDELVDYIQFAYCIKCGMCLSACPTCATDEEYTGPMALAQAWRYHADNRDQDENLRLQKAQEQKGIWRCHFAGECSEVCPKGVDPAFAIQLLKRTVVLKKIGFKKQDAGALLAPPVTDWEPNPKIPKPPDPTR